MVVVLATEEIAAKKTPKPVWIRGVGFANDSATLESRNWQSALYAQTAAKNAYRQAGIDGPQTIDFYEVDDTYAYKELQHLVALGVYADAAAAVQALDRGETQRTGKAPVNVSGGALGLGYTFEAAGLYRVVELALQLRGQAGQRQLSRARTGLAQSWRGVPTTSGAVVILGSERPQ